jgi:PhnB protein
MQIQAYLFLEGRCDEAIAFYAKALDAKLEMRMQYDESPGAEQAGMIPPGSEKKVMHASMRADEAVLMLSDGFCKGPPNFAGFALSLDCADQAEAQRRFDALAEGGAVKMPLSPTFFSPAFGMVADKFGVTWMLIVSPPA